MLILPITSNTPTQLPFEVVEGLLNGIPVLVCPDAYGTMLSRCGKVGETLEETFNRLINTKH